MIKNNVAIMDISMVQGVQRIEGSVNHVTSLVILKSVAGNEETYLETLTQLKLKQMMKSSVKIKNCS